MHTFFILLGAAALAYRLFVKGESVIVKNPNWKIRGLACLAMGLSLVAVSAYGLVVIYLHSAPIPGILWVSLVVGVSIAASSVPIMMRV